VRDIGHGIPYAEAPALFTKLGGSWKRDKKRSRLEILRPNGWHTTVATA
jgi:hypothetical protein